jgi:hypothetical protein
MVGAKVPYVAICAGAVACLLAVMAWGQETDYQPNLIIENNVISDSGFGIYLGWGGTWTALIRDNEITGNGEGIRLVNLAAYIEGNRILDNIIGLKVTPEHEEELVAQVEWVLLRYNLFEGNELYAVLNLADVLILAPRNWWGQPDGPRILLDLGELGAWPFPRNSVMGPLECPDWLSTPGPTE